ncbi:transferase family-domain-containing protein [Podospora didyma]|uniref:Transferase family-domain-containing protein n=1 Tax=Podospora didyma TaxID=330526 RepID=A0AAE0KL82_9PEZI|nr:transferase family-domain-containing protein [Podospora didyma]
MSSTHNSDDIASSYLSPLDQLVPRGYFGEVLCFPCTDKRVLELLRNGLKSAAESIPYLTSFVIADTNISKKGWITLSESGADSLDDMLVCHDLPSLETDMEKERVSYTALRDASFPIGTLNHALFYPDIPPHGILPAPVLRAQATLVTGGVLLAVLVHHSVFDGTALNDLLTLWAASCHLGAAENHTAIQISPRRLDRRALLPKAVDIAPATWPSEVYVTAHSGTSGRNLATKTASQFGHVLKHVLQALKPTRSPPPASLAKLSTTLHRISSSSLAELKTQINRILPQINNCSGSQDVAFVSTNDVITALISCAVATTAPPDAISSRRFWKKRNKAQESILGVAINIRPRLSPPLPPDFLGNGLGVAWISVPQKTLVNAGSEASLVLLARVAATIRSGVARVDDSSVKNLIRWLDTYPGNIHDEVWWRPADRMFDFYVSSWAGQKKLYEMDWGSGSELLRGMRCEAIRCLQLVVKDIAVILPPRKTIEGSGEEDFELAVTLEAGQMERLQQSMLMRAFTEVIDVC